MRTRLVLTAAATALAAGGVAAVLVPPAAGAAGASTESVLTSADEALDPAAADLSGRHRQRLLTREQRQQLRSTGHLTFTKDTKRRGTLTIAVQLGEITAITPTSVTLRSKDGYTHTYVLTEKTRVRVRRQPAATSDVKVGAKAAVVALVTPDGDQARRLALRPGADGAGRVGRGSPSSDRPANPTRT